MSYAYATSNEKAISGALALAMHVAFLVLIVLGVSWQQKRPDSAVVVDLWASLPPAAQPKPEPPKPEPPKPEPPKPEPPKPEPPKPEPPKPEPLKPEPPKPEPPKPEPRPPEPEPAPAPKPAPPKPEPKAAPKPDIELKAKLDKERKQKEQQAAEARRLAERKKREEEKKRAEAKRIEDERQRAEAAKREEEKKLAALKAQQAKEAAARREQEEALKRLAAEQAAAQQRLIDEYTRRIRDKIRRFVVEPPNLQGNPEVEFDVVVLPGGEVLGVKMRKSSTVAAYDSAVERAILKAQPLPLPPDPALFKDFRELKLKFRPKE